MKSIGDDINGYCILKHQSSSMLYDRYIVEQASHPGRLSVLQKWNAVHFTSNQGRTTFLTQMNTLKNLHDPFILPMEDFGIDADDHPYLVLPHKMAQMVTLADRLQSGVLAEDDCESILVDTSAALARAHQHNIIHGYLSPECILLTLQGEVLVTAFLSPCQGISMERDALPLRYRFPESTVSRLSDQYALAGLVQTLLLEQEETPEDAPILREAIARAQNQNPTQRFKSIRDFLGEMGIALHLPERDTELEPMPPQVASLYTQYQPGAHYTPQPYSTFLNNGQRKQAYVSTTRRWSQLRFWINFIGIGIFTIATLTALIHYMESYQCTAENHGQLEIAASRGENIVIHIPMKGSINSLWASDQGVQLQLDEWKPPLEIVPPTPKSWDSTISTDITGGNKSYTLDGSFTLPSTLSGPEMRDLHGLITGHILYPTDSGFGFENESTSLSIPVHIHVISEAMRQSNSGENTFWQLAALEGIFIVSILLVSKIAQYQWSPAMLVLIVGETAEERVACRKGLIRGVIVAGILIGIIQIFRSMHIDAPSSNAIVYYILLFIGICIILLLRFIFARIFRR